MLEGSSTKDVDFETLSKEFGIETIENEVLEMRDRLKNVKDLGDSNDILKLNIERANFMLDLAEKEMISGNFNSRLLEGCSSLIGQITAAANSLMCFDQHSQDIDLKVRTLDLKEFEVKTKIEMKKEQQSLPAGGQTNIQNNIVLTTREDFLKMVKKNQLSPEVLEAALSNEGETQETLDITSKE